MAGRTKKLFTPAPSIAAPVLWCASALSAAGVGPGPCPAPPPCSPDGACLPRYETWGWYPTRWRSFPGDDIGVKPSPAADQSQEPSEEDLRGPRLPEAVKEGVMGPEKPERGGALGEAVEGDAAEGAPAGEGAPGALEPAAPPAGGPVAPADDAPAPGSPEDPFSAAPPTPPWMVKPAVATQQSLELMATPAVDFQPVEQPAPQAEAPDQGLLVDPDDAPPALPASILQALTGVRAPQAPLAATPMLQLPDSTAPASTPTGALPESLPPIADEGIMLAQPASLQPAAQATLTDRQAVVPASALATPENASLVNPAVALIGDAANEDSQQAVYFEASDGEAADSQVRPAAP